MKKMLALLLNVCLLGVSLCLPARAEEMLMGGWTVNEDSPADIPQEIVEALAQAAEETADTYGYEPMLLLSSQVVSGMNYCLLCRVTGAEGQCFYAQVYLYVDLKGQSRMTSVEPLTYGNEEERAQETVLPVVLSGQEEEVRAALYQGNGYTMYVPLGGWMLVSREEDGLRSDCWTSVNDARAQLTIIDMTGRSPADVRDWIRENYPDYELLEDKRGGMFGSSGDEAQLMNVVLDGTAETCFALIAQYDAEAAEGDGTVIGVMMDTFWPR